MKSNLAPTLPSARVIPLVFALAGFGAACEEKVDYNELVFPVADVVLDLAETGPRPETRCVTWAGEGTCRTASTCGLFVAADGGYCPGNQICCVEAEPVECTANGSTGICRDAELCPSGYGHAKGDCAGGVGVECCYQDPLACIADGVDGDCTSSADCLDPNQFNRGGCADESLGCCTPPPAACTARGNNGLCIRREYCADPTDFVSDDECSAGTGCCYTVGGACPVGQYECADGTCINDNGRCDDTNDCGDLSDELGCLNSAGVLCAPTQFPCFDKCLAGSLACNGAEDCVDGLDEAGCR